jgi:5'-nucleotidase
MKNGKYQILLTNDDGIQSPGLWAAAEALSKIGFVTVAAPRQQATSAGRSYPISSDGKITPTSLKIGEQIWTCYAIGGSPAQSVLHGLFEVMPFKPDLVVSGINYGENIGHGITISGTVGAALEAASMGIPALATSLQLEDTDWYSYSPEVDFSTAAYFTAYFAQKMLENQLPPDVDVLKLDVPDNATPQTPWRVTRIGRHRYYMPAIQRSGDWNSPSQIACTIGEDLESLPKDSDIYTLVVDRMVSVCPLSLDLTSRVDFKDLTKNLE